MPGKLRYRRHLPEWRFRRSFVRRIRRRQSRIKARTVCGGFAIEPRQRQKAGACAELRALQGIAARHALAGG